MAEEPKVGEEFAGYRIESVLGRGGMGVVFLAEDWGLKRKVALKVLAPELAEDAAFRDRFIQESQVAANLEHPNIVPIFEAGETDGVLYMAMRYVKGKDLGTILHEEERLSPRRAISLVGQVAGALDAAHAAGLVHRDVKPANVLVTPAPDPGSPEHAYLADFGVTKRLTTQARRTATGALVGTLDYVAPELIEGRAVDRRADVYSLGCVLFESLTGQLPFRRESEAATMWAHVRDKPPAVTALRPDAPHGLDRVLAKALSKAPEFRYRTAGELAAAARAVVGSGGDERPVAPPPETPRGRRPALLVGGGIAALIVAVVVVLLAGRGSAPRSVPPGAPSSPSAQPSPSPSVTSPEPADLVEGLGLFRLDPDTGLPVQTIDESVVDPALVDELSVGAGGLWVYQNATGELREVKPQTRAVAAITHADPGFSSLLVTTSTGVWLAYTDHVVRIDPVTARPVATIPLVHRPVHGAAGAGLVWFFGPGSGRLVGSIVGVDPDTNTVAVAVPLPNGVTNFCALDAALWVVEPVGPNLGPPRMQRIDPRTGRVTASVALPIKPSALACGGHQIWLLDAKLVLVGYEPRAGLDAPVATLPIPGEEETGFGGDFTTRILMAGSEVFIVQGRSRTLWIVDRQLKSILQTVHFRGFPDRAATDGRAVWLLVR